MFFKTSDEVSESLSVVSDNAVITIQFVTLGVRRGGGDKVP